MLPKYFNVVQKKVMMMKTGIAFPHFVSCCKTILSGCHGVIRSLILLFHVSRRSLFISLCWIEFKLICKQSFFTNVEKDLLRT